MKNITNIKNVNICLRRTQEQERQKSDRYSTAMLIRCAKNRLMCVMHQLQAPAGLFYKMALILMSIILYNNCLYLR